MRSLALIALLWLSGCHRIVYPGNGPLVVVTLDDDFYNHYILEGAKQYQEAGLIAEGIRVWDACGAHLRMMEQLTNDEKLVADAAPHLHFNYSDFDPTLWGSTMAGDYVSWNGQITLYSWAMAEFDKTTLIEEAAHESGHAIGLNHVPDSNAIMFWQLHYSDKLEAADFAEHARVWP
jgi:hypothetical protein